MGDLTSVTTEGWQTEREVGATCEESERVARESVAGRQRAVLGETD